VGKGLRRGTKGCAHQLERLHKRWAEGLVASREAMPVLVDEAVPAPGVAFGDAERDRAAPGKEEVATREAG
jgi:hypothetical protein